MSPLSIALICPYSFSSAGGVQNHVLGLAGWLSGRGHRVALFGPGAPPEDAMVRAGLRMDQFTSAGRAIPVRYNGSVARINFGPLEARRVSAWLRQVRPDVLHVHEPITPSVSLLGLWMSWAPVVATFHTATPGSRALAAARRLLARSIASIAAGIAVSSVARDVVRSHLGLDPQIIGNGISIGPMPDDLRRTAWRGGEHPRITFVGRYDEPRKGFGVFQSALPEIRAHFPRADIRVVGAGSDHPIPGVTFTGYVGDDERDAIMGGTDVYVAPQTGRESFGIVILEALSAGADVVASDLPAFREVLTDDHEDLVGSLAAVGDPAALAARVLDVLQHPAPERRVAGWHHAATYDWSVIGQRIEQVYGDVIGGRATSEPWPPR